MDINLLKTFLAVAGTGSFSAAAQEIHCVQSNVTARIRRLEQHLGKAVFERGRGGARLTDFGSRLHAHAEDLVARFEAAERDLLDAAGTSAPLKLGAMETTAAVRLPALLKSLKRKHPGAPLSLRTGPTAELLSLIWERKLDTAFVAAPVDEDRFRHKLAFHEDLMVVRSSESQSDQSLLAFRSGCSYRARGENWLASEGHSDTEIVEMGTLEGILGCVEAGMGFAVAPESAARKFHGISGLTLTPLPAPYGDVEVHLVWRIDHKPAQVHVTLCELLQTR